MPFVNQSPSLAGSGFLYFFHSHSPVMKASSQGYLFQQSPIRKHQWRDVIELISETIAQDVDELLVCCKQRISHKGTGDNKFIESICEDNMDFRVKSISKIEFASIQKQAGYAFHSSPTAVLDSFFCESKSSSLKQLNQLMKRLGKNSGEIMLSNDGQLVIKRIPKSQFVHLTDHLLPNGLKDLFNQPTSLSLKLLGAFSLEDLQVTSLISQQYNTFYYILMENLLREWDFENTILTAIYDVKGSNIGREADSDDSSDEEQIKTDVLLGKDNDLQRRGKDKDAIASIDVETKAQLLKTITEESKIFESTNTMDYSLLMLIGEVKHSNYAASEATRQTSKLKSFRGIATPNWKTVVSFGLIDYLSEYDFNRLIENKFKSFFFAAGDTKISCVEPPAYRQRLLTYVKNDILRL